MCVDTFYYYFLRQVDPGFEWSPRISPAVVPDLGTASLPDTLMTVSGWGWTGVNCNLATNNVTFSHSIYFSSLALKLGSFLIHYKKFLFRL